MEVSPWVEEKWKKGNVTNAQMVVARCQTNFCPFISTNKSFLSCFSLGWKISEHQKHKNITTTTTKKGKNKKKHKARRKIPFYSVVCDCVCVYDVSVCVCYSFWRNFSIIWWNVCCWMLLDTYVTLKAHFCCSPYAMNG